MQQRWILAQMMMRDPACATMSRSSGPSATCHGSALGDADAEEWQDYMVQDWEAVRGQVQGLQARRCALTRADRFTYKSCGRPVGLMLAWMAGGAATHTRSICRKPSRWKNYAAKGPRSAARRAWADDVSCRKLCGMGRLRGESSACVRNGKRLSSHLTGPMRDAAVRVGAKEGGNVEGKRRRYVCNGVVEGWREGERERGKE